MNHRENLLSLLRRQGHEFVPTHFRLCPSLIETYEKTSASDLAYEDYFNFSMREVSKPELPPAPAVPWRDYYRDTLHDDTLFDEWGVAHEPGSEAAMHMTRMRHPMRDFNSLEQIAGYPYPDFENASYQHIAAEVKELHERGVAAFFTMADMIWEIAWYLRGMEALMMDMAGENERATFLLDKCTELACVRAEAYARCGLDILHTGDDVGMQQNMMMAPVFWRTWLKPRMAKVVRSAKRINPDILFSFHSCGYIEPIIGDLIDIGVDILNPIQPECMSFERIHDRFGDRLSFWGTIGTQTTMPFGSTDEVRAEVKRNLTLAGEKGGLLCTPTHLLEPEVPWGNIVAYVETCAEGADF